MNIVSINVNGLKAFYEKGAFDSLITRFSPSILCMQETKCSESKVGYWISDYNYQYVPFSSSNHRKHGYAGVTTLVNEDLMGQFIDADYPVFDGLDDYGYGRIVVVKFESFNLLNVYTLNSGDKDEQRVHWNSQFRKYVKELLKENNLIIVGDMNVVSSQLDYCGRLIDTDDACPGLKLYERTDHDEFMKETKMIDTFRFFYPETRCYSWFSYQNQAYKNNNGWRIDLALVNNSMISNLKLDHVITDSKVHPDFIGSDHRPIELILT